MADRTLARRGWRIDLKWIAGIVCVILLIPTLFAYQLGRITSEEQARTFITGATNGVLNEFLTKSFRGNYAQLQDYVKRNPGAKLPLELPVKITTSDILKSKDIDGLVVIISERMFEQIYTGEGIEFSDTSAEQIPALAVIAPVLNFISADTHKALQQIFIFALVGALLFALPALIFSYRWGRLMTLGAVVAVPAVIVASTFSLLQLIVNATQVGESSLVVVKDLIFSLLNNAGSSAWIIFWSAFGLYVVAGAVSYIWYRYQSKDKRPVEY